jgi:hypothetical protein
MVASLRFFADSWIINFNYPTKYDYAKGSNIGNLINGLTAPILTIFATIILYITLHRQTDANKILREEINISNFFKTYNEINSMIDATVVALKDYKKAKIQISGDRNEKNKITSIAPDVSSVGFDKLYTFIRLVDETTRSIELFNDPADNFHYAASNAGFNYKKVIRLKAFTFLNYELNRILNKIKDLDDYKEDKDFNILKKSVYAVHERFNRSNSSFWGSSTMVLSLKIPQNKSTCLNIDFDINEDGRIQPSKNNLNNAISLDTSKFKTYCLFLLKKFLVKRNYTYKIKVANYVTNLYINKASLGPTEKKSGFARKEFDVDHIQEIQLENKKNYYLISTIQNNNGVEKLYKWVIKIVRAQ